MAVIPQFITPQVVYIQKETSNKSFLDMHHYLQSKGIQNNDFFLVLYDPGLAGVNPRDPNLSIHMKSRITMEITKNYWYFIREVVRIPVAGGDANGGDQYRLHRGNLAMNFLFTINFNFFMELPRQHGKTVGAMCRYLWVYNFGTTNSEIMFMHKDHKGSKDNLKTLRSIRDALPGYLQMASGTGADGKKLKVPNTIVTMQHPYNNNRITTFPSARTRDAANNLGRGSTMPLQYYDEFAFIPFNKIVYLAASPAFSTASKNAARNHAPYGMCITTTPGDLLNDSGAFAYKFRNQATVWREEYYDKSYEELCGLRDANTESNFFLISYSYKQLGSGNEYFNKMRKDLVGDWDAIRREILLEWAEVAEDCAFSKEDLDKIGTFIVKEPIRTLFFGKFGQYQFNIYKDIDTNYPPIIGVDVSGAVMSDSSAITIIDSRTTEVCATLNCNFIPADDLAQVIYEIVSKYLPNAVINIERNGGFGAAVVQRLVKTSVKKNLYWEIKDKVVEERFDGAKNVKVNRKVKIYGTDSTKSVRNRLIEILYERVKYHKDKFTSPYIWEEMKAMQVKKNGKVEHSDKSHDDQVFSYLMALYVWYEGKNLAEKFNIIKNTLRTDDNMELDELQLEDELELRESLDTEKMMITDDTVTDELMEQLEFIEQNSNLITSRDLADRMFIEDSQARSLLLSSDKNAREAYCIGTGTDPSSFEGDYNVNVTLPDTLFDMDFDEDDDPYKDSPLDGNLKDYWDLV